MDCLQSEHTDEGDTFFLSEDQPPLHPMQRATEVAEYIKRDEVSLMVQDIAQPLSQPKEEVGLVELENGRALPIRKNHQSSLMTH